MPGVTLCARARGGAGSPARCLTPNTSVNARWSFWEFHLFHNPLASPAQGPTHENPRSMRPSGSYSGRPVPAPGGDAARHGPCAARSRPGSPRGGGRAAAPAPGLHLPSGSGGAARPLPSMPRAAEAAPADWPSPVEWGRG